MRDILVDVPNTDKWSIGQKCSLKIKLDVSTTE